MKQVGISAYFSFENLVSSVLLCVIIFMEEH